MRGRWWIGAATVLVTLTVWPAGTAVAGVRLIHTVRDLDGFSATPTQVGWAAPSDCDAVYRATFATGRTVRLSGCFGDAAASGVSAPLELAGGRAYWGIDSFGETEDVWGIQTATAATGRRQIAHGDLSCGAAGCLCGNDGLVDGTTAAAGGVAYYFTRQRIVGSQCSSGIASKDTIAGGDVQRAHRTSRGGIIVTNVSGAPSALMLAASAGRILIVPATGLDYDLPDPTNLTVQIRDGANGALVSSFQPVGTIEAVALSSRLAAVLVGSGSQLRLVWYAVSDGHQVGSRTLASTHAAMYGMNRNGRRILFSVRRHIDILRTDTGRVHLVHIARRGIFRAVISGRLVAWAVAWPRGWRIAATVLPRLP